LAADINECGLIHAIVLDKDGQVLDGRNRLAACEIAGVEPRFTTYEGDDPAGYALAVNITRRHLTKGQQAMILTSAHLLETDKRGWQVKVGKDNDISQPRLAQASVVLQHAPDLADEVVSGRMSLDTALAEGFCEYPVNILWLRSGEYPGQGPSL